MDSRPEISIIMAVYNCEDTVIESMESILNQSFQDFEFVICDDCSEDNTYEIIRSYADRYPDKIVVLKNERNSKLAYSLNCCLQHARGNYIARMDGDDVSESDRLQKQYDFLVARPDYDLVGTSVSFFDGGEVWGGLRKTAIPNKKDKLGGVCFNHATILVKEAVYNSLGGYTDVARTVRCEDLDLWYKFFAAGFKGYNMEEALYRVRLAPSDMNRRKFRDKINGVKTRISGYRLLGFKWYDYVHLLKPIVAAFVPNRLMLLYHKMVLR